MDNRALLSGVVIGAVLALAADPLRFNRRRIIVRDTVVRGGRRAGDALDRTARDLGNRARGLAARARRRFLQEEISDQRLLERVRARIGRVCSHPRAIEVEAHDGEVTLRGPALAEEVRALMTAAASVDGVHAVINELEPHDSPAGIPSLQGRGRTLRPVAGTLPWQWPAATQALAGAAAFALGGLALALVRR